jgi:hypothetical protein
MEERAGNEDSKSLPPQAGELTPPHASQEEERSERLCDFGFGSSQEGDSRKLKVKGWVPLLLLLLAVGVCAAIIVGCILPSFSFATQGIVNIVIEAGQGFREIVNHRSIFSMSQLLIQQAEYLATPKTRVGLGSLAVLLVLNTLIVPLIHVVLVVAQFVLPLSPRAHSNLEVAIEVSQDWQYLDVYVISILISLSQLGTFSESLVNPFCSGINNLLSELAYFKVIKQRDDQCYRVQAEIDSGGYVLLAAAAMMAVLRRFVTKAFEQYRRNKAAVTEANNSQALNTSTDVNDTNRVRKLIQPPSVMFADTFWFFLYPEIPPPSTTVDNETNYRKEKNIDDDTPPQDGANDTPPQDGADDTPPQEGEED